MCHAGVMISFTRYQYQLNCFSPPNTIFTATFGLYDKNVNKKYQHAEKSVGSTIASINCLSDLAATFLTVTQFTGLLKCKFNKKSPHTNCWFKAKRNVLKT